MRGGKGEGRDLFEGSALRGEKEIFWGWGRDEKVRGLLGAERGRGVMGLREVYVGVGVWGVINW